MKDTEVRKEATAFLAATLRLAQPAKWINHSQVQSLTDSYNRATELIGELLRERY